MSVPNLFYVVEHIYQSQSWNLAVHSQCGEFTHACAVALHKADRRFGHLKKRPGQNQHNGHAVDAVLYLSDVPGQSTAIDIIARSEDPSAAPAWQPDIPRYSPSDWYAPEGGPDPVDPPPPPPPPVDCRFDVKEIISRLDALTAAQVAILNELAAVAREQRVQAQLTDRAANHAAQAKQFAEDGRKALNNGLGVTLDVELRTVFGLVRGNATGTAKG